IQIKLQSVLPRLSCSPFILREIASLSGRDSTTRQDEEEERGEIDRGLLRKWTLFSSEKEEKQIHRNRVPQTVFPAVCREKKGVADRGSLSRARGEKRGKRGEKPSKDRVQPSNQEERSV